ncbi:MAG: ankyrin repeat domain-containing protein (plasmid) [Phormidium sp.]
MIRHALADAAKQYNWKKTQFILDERPDLINVTRPDGRSLYTPLHQAAHGNAPMEVVQQMVEMGAWRTLRNTDDERAVDIAVLPYLLC